MSPKAKVQASEINIKACEQCGRPFRTVHDEAVLCGAYFCYARKYWPRSRWEAQIRMAQARIAGGLDLSELDQEAGRRLGIDLLNQKEETQ